ncbi:MAG: diguanylate cyclase [Planctomycetia bacterium]|nr:diguanylate cyclase [Planctomycetia bacterium]
MATDHVTGLATRGDFEAWLNARVSFAGVTLLIVDVVGLKAVNEQRGFLAGDHALRLAADRLRDLSAGATLVARLGGDELVAVFPDADGAARATRSLAEANTAPTLRIGVTAGTDADTRETLVDRLYARLHAVPRQGQGVPE